MLILAKAVLSMMIGFILSVILGLILIPLLIVGLNNSQDIMIKMKYGSISNKVIKVKRNKTNEIVEVPLEEYVIGVVAGEMPASFNMEALKAQATVARTYTVYQIKNGGKHENADLCDSALCCQAWITKENRMSRWEENVREEYWNKIIKAVNETKGKFILYNGEPINALFHSNSGGTTELSINVWGGEFPYFKTVETSGEENYTSYSSEVIVSKDELISKMLEKYSEFKIDFSSNNQIEILERTNSNRVSKLKIGNIEISGVEARSIFGLKSAKFNVEILDDNIKFSVLGYGHGVGFSQCGSDTLAKNGKNYEEIIKYYYKDIEISE